MGGMGIVSDSEFLRQKNSLVSCETDTVPSTSSELNYPNQPNNSINNNPPIPDFLDSSTQPIIKTIERGRASNDVQTPEVLRKLIGETAHTEGRKSAVSLAEKFGLSPSSASAYAHGATSTATYDKTDNPVGDHITKVKGKISVKAHKKLMLALNSITPEKIADAKLSVIAGVARDMSVIVKNLEPPAKDNDDKNIHNGPSFIFYAPKFKDETAFPIVHAKD